MSQPITRVSGAMIGGKSIPKAAKINAAAAADLLKYNNNSLKAATSRKPKLKIKLNQKLLLG
jgi:hypothetical protein